jgi:hypothetical protein
MGENNHIVPTNAIVETGYNIISSLFPDRARVHSKSYYSDKKDIGLFIGMICDSYIQYKRSLNKDRSDSLFNVDTEVYKDAFLNGIDKLIQEYKPHVTQLASSLNMDEKSILELMEASKLNSKHPTKGKNIEGPSSSARSIKCQEEFAEKLLIYLNGIILQRSLN